MYMPFLTLVSDLGSFNDLAEKFPGPLLLKSDVNLFNHLVRKMLRVVLRVLFFVDMRLPYSVSLICIV